MDQARRVALKAGGAWGVLSAFAALGLMTPAQATAARNDVAFDATSMVAALRALGVDAPTPSDQIEITAPEVAENGAVVRVAVASALPETALVALLGWAAGLALGLAAVTLYRDLALEPKGILMRVPDLRPVVLSVLVPVLSTLVACTVLARRLARMDPVQVIQRRGG